jgi:exosome complex RNA-binding protein Rrp42 (RNase PH superfamily)
MQTTTSSSTQAPPQRCWILYIDALILRYGGNITDVMSVACKAALAQVQLPRCVVTRCVCIIFNDCNYYMYIYSVDEGRGVGALDKWTVELDKQSSPICLWDTVIAHAPLLITVHKLGTASVVDPSDNEEVRVCVCGVIINLYILIFQLCSTSALVVGVCPSTSTITCVQQWGVGSVQRDTLTHMCDMGIDAAKQLDTAMQEYFTLKKKNDGGKK